MTRNKGIIFRVKPTAQQCKRLAQHFGQNRFLWNYFLNKRRREYQENKQSSNYYRDCLELTRLKQQPDYAWLYDFSTASQQRTLKNLDDAYKRFFKRKAKFPRFKSKKHDQSFTLAGGIKLKEKRIYFPKFPEGLKFNRDLPVFTKINNITVRKTASGKYYVCLSVEAEVVEKLATGQQVGIDLGLTDFAVVSTGKRIKAPKYFRQQQAALKRAQQHLSRKQKGSNRREQQRIKVAKIHEQITNARKDFHHKASAFTIKHFDTIVVEDLHVKGMVRNSSLSKSIGDVGWSGFVSMLDYKAAWYGRKLVKIDRFYPSSKTAGRAAGLIKGCSYRIGYGLVHPVITFMIEIGMQPGIFYKKGYALFRRGNRRIQARRRRKTRWVYPASGCQ